MKKLDLKSALVGVAAGVALTLCLGATTSTLSGSVGRFQMGATAGHAFVIDTATGKVWAGNFPAHMSISTDKDFRNPKLQAE